MINYKRIAYRIYISRKKLGLTQEQLSVLLGQAYGNSDVSNMEHAKKGSGIYRLDKLEVYANVLNIDIKWLIFGDRLEEEMKKMYSDYPDRYQKLLDEVDKKDDWDKLYEKYGFENMERMDTFDENKIFNNLEIPFPDHFVPIDWKKDEFNGLDIVTPYYPSHVRKALKIAGYGKKFLSDTRKDFPITADLTDAEAKNTRDYAGLTMAEFPTDFGYATIITAPVVTAEIGWVYVPHDMRDDIALMEKLILLMFNKEGKCIGKLSGYDIRLIEFYTDPDIFGTLDSEDASLSDEFFIMQKAMYPGKITDDYEENDLLYEKYIEKLQDSDDDWHLYSIFLCIDVNVPLKYRKKKVFTTMRGLLHEWNGALGECYCLWSESEKQIKTNIEIAKKMGLSIVKDDSEFYVDASEECPYAYIAEPVKIK